MERGLHGDAWARHRDRLSRFVAEFSGRCDRVHVVGTLDDSHDRYWFGGIQYDNLASFLIAFLGTYTRDDDVATFVGSNGLIQKVTSSNTPRLTYSPGASPVALGYLAEEKARNFQIKSEEFDDDAWEKPNVVVTSNNATAPDGNMTADLITSKSETSVQTIQDIVTMAGGLLNIEGNDRSFPADHKKYYLPTLLQRNWVCTFDIA